MAHERKSESAVPATRSPVPVAKRDDLEDVAWALQTAEAMWSRGDETDALKWIRRAAEAASEAEADDRALELAKAAADVATILADRRAPAGPPPIPPTPQAPPVAAVSKAQPPLSFVPQARPAAGAPPIASKVVTAPALPRAGQKTPSPPKVSAPAARRGARRGSGTFDDDNDVTKFIPAPSRGRGSVTSEAKKRRNSKPPPDETAQHSPVTARHPSVEELDAWPTASLLGDDDDDGQHTRIGEPAYVESAKTASARPPALLAPGPPLVMTQAVRVVVWRGPDGVHVAPAGTQVAAIAVEAVLVALDPGTDLAAWLNNK